MSGLGKVVAAPFKAIGSLFSTPKAPDVAPTPTRDDVEIASGEMRSLRKRRGGGANELLGEGGAEATGAQAPKKQLTGE